MRKIVDLALAAGAALAAIAPALADSQLSAECLEMDLLRASANNLHALVDVFQARLRDEQARLRDEEVEAEENRYFARFDAEKTRKVFRHLDGVPVERSPSRDHFARSRWQSSARYVDDRDEQPSRLLRSGSTSKTLTPSMPITLTIDPLWDGSNGGQFLTATLPDGRQMDGGRPATTRLQSLGDQASAKSNAIGLIRGYLDMVGQAREVHASMGEQWA
jgi:hypothetical protein